MSLISRGRPSLWHPERRASGPTPGTDFVTDKLDLRERCGRTIRIGFYLDTENEASDRLDPIGLVGKGIRT